MFKQIKIKNNFRDGIFDAKFAKNHIFRQPIASLDSQTDLKHFALNTNKSNGGTLSKKPHPNRDFLPA